MKLPLLVTLFAAVGYSATPGKPEAPKNMMAAIPLHFEPNVGQTDSRVSFTARGGGMSIFLTPEETVLARRGATPVRMKLRGSKRAKFEAIDKLPGVSNYYRGNDPKKWREGVPHYARVRAKSVYEGIDVVYYGNGRRLEYDFVVAPGADPSKIELAFEGADSMSIDKGDLVLVTKAGELRQRKPVVYQEVEGRRVEVAAEYRLQQAAVSLALARYDARKPIVIDPILEYGTYLGGEGNDQPAAVAADTTGVWVAGRTDSTSFPDVTPADSTRVNEEGFITRINSTGDALVFSTFLGGSNADHIAGLVIDASGNAFVSGNTYSPDFPVVNALQSTFGTGQDAIAARLSPEGALTFATFLGGTSFDHCDAIAVTAAGVSLSCRTASPTFLGDTGDTYRPLLVRLALNGARVIFTKVLAGDVYVSAIAADAAGGLYLTGSATSLTATAGAFQTASGGTFDAFVAKLNPAGDQWVYVTLLGGSGPDKGNSISIDSAGQAYVAGETGSSNFPVRNAHKSNPGAGPGCCELDAFLTVLNSAGSALVFSTYFGGSGSDNALYLATMPGGGAVIAGLTSSPDFPILSGWAGGGGSYFAKFSAGGNLIYSSTYGPFDRTIIRAVSSGPAGAVYIAGSVSAYDTPPHTVTPGAFDTTPSGPTDAFVARFVDGPAPIQVTLTSNPVGRQLYVDRRTVITPAVLWWQPGTPHFLSSGLEMVGQTFYTLTSWAHGGSVSQWLIAPNSATTYTANFTATACSYSFSPSSLTAGFEGSRAFTVVDTQNVCKWIPQSSAPWLTVDSAPNERTGGSAVSLIVQANLGGPRSATVTAGSATLTVTQSGGQAGLSAPSITAPSLDQTIQTEGLHLSWTPVSGAAGYEVRIVQTNCCSSVPGTPIHFSQQAGANSTSTTIDLPDGSYSAYVRACANAGFGDSNCGTFATVPFTVNLLAPNRMPVILSPVHNQILRTSTNLISWEPLIGATSYDVMLVNQWTRRIELSINTTTLGTVFTMKSSKYDLYVRGCQAKCSQYTASTSFQVQLPPVPQNPPSGLTGQIASGNTLNLSWNPVTNADLYRVQVVQPNSGPGGGALTVAAKQVSTTNASLQVPAGAATVVLTACNGDGCGPASTIAVNPTGPNPSVPIVATPMPVVVADGPNITISWSRIPGDNGSNTDYRLYVGDLSRDGPALDVITKNNFYGAFLRAEGRRYDALVFATQNGNTVVGPASGFMVAGSSATAPLITSPTHNSTFKQGPFRLAWSPIPDAVRYQYYVGRQGQTGPALTGVTPGIFVDTSLSVTAPTQHQAIVRACPTANANQCSPDSDAGWGPWSQNVTGTTSFTIAP